MPQITVQVVFDPETKKLVCNIAPNSSMPDIEPEQVTCSP